MAWTAIKDLTGRTGEEGPQGKDGQPGTGSVPADTFIAATLDPDAAGSLAKAALDKNLKGKGVRTFPTQLGIMHAAFALRNDRPVVVAGAGSSTMAGYVASNAASQWFNILAATIQAAYPLVTRETQPPTRTLAEAVAVPPSSNGIQFVNAGLPGTFATNYLTSTTGGQLAALNPNVVMHMIGANDWAADVPVSTYKAAILARIAQLDADSNSPILHILLHSYARFDPSADGPLTWEVYGQALAEIAASKPANVVSFDLSPWYVKVGVPSSDPFNLVSSDDLHQSNSGHAFMAEIMRTLLGVPGPAPTREIQVSPSRVTSDVFATTAVLNGRVTDLAFGGSAKTWLDASAGFTTNSAGVIPTTTATAAFAGFTIAAQSAQVGAVCVSLPSAGGLYVNLFRDTAGTDAYRLAFTSDGLAVQKRVGGTTTTLFSLDAVTTGSHAYVLRSYRGVLSLLRNGVEIFVRIDSSVSAGGSVGISRDATAITGRITRFFVDVLG
ncbi:SGNH/GDSL hydrolase family protein [Cryobacterium soli]|uniref:SGNH/GDSL hydrolase family protein n=1 Tax=Cryobacterium soli TaxID=2220095 RepID=UPI000E741AF7|nr:SGNH/GDSL hydrolase family protein [Cryobacterium soli]